MSLLYDLVGFVVDWSLDLLQFYLDGVLLLFLVATFFYKYKKITSPRQRKSNIQSYVYVLFSSVALFFALVILEFPIARLITPYGNFKTQGVLYHYILFSIPPVWTGLIYPKRSWLVGVPLAAVEAAIIMQKTQLIGYPPLIMIKVVLFISLPYIVVNLLVSFGVRLYLKRKDSRILDKKVLISSENDEAVRKGL